MTLCFCRVRTLGAVGGRDVGAIDRSQLSIFELQNESGSGSGGSGIKIDRFHIPIRKRQRCWSRADDYSNIARKCPSDFSVNG